ncbi:cob(I)yrinic acid a,c-diamide adenosyltransferase [Xylanibacillus composti]|uniref:Cob(I)alamin adenosyltransferase n=2 Tax=Xylanibacillus composti TaxID=1572762 RepID=A0A8J4GYU3_9BACL|nr:cob(I)yrinic acid a,c-diamide adenosyltransferase [Xylanibacillus composti]GIQ67727.1 cob(I)alamin adenosyltransferase [Xylanibacillus composti]
MLENEAKRKGMTLTYTGNGKGKTTAAVGIAVRAAGRGMKVRMIQFIKSPERTYGEKLALAKLGIEVLPMGVGFTWLKTPEEHRQALQSAWAEAKQTAMSGEYDVVIWDEIHNALAIDRFPIDDVLSLEEVLQTIRNRPSHVHLVLTGRQAHEDVKAASDLVSVIEPEKHYYEEGVQAIRGLEF